MRDCTYKMLVINGRLDYLSLYAHQSMHDGASSIIGTISNAQLIRHRQMATAHSCIINCNRLLSCGLFVMPCHGKIHCTSFNDGNPMIHCKKKNALVTVTVGLGCTVTVLTLLPRTNVARQGSPRRPHTTVLMAEHHIANGIALTGAGSRDQGPGSTRAGSTGRRGRGRGSRTPVTTLYLLLNRKNVYKRSQPHTKCHHCILYHLA
jgi:hypothetical protein